MGAVAAGAHAECLLLDHDRVLALDHFDRRVHDVRHVHAHGRGAVLRGGFAPPPPRDPPEGPPPAPRAAPAPGPDARRPPAPRGGARAPGGGARPLAWPR